MGSSPQFNARIEARNGVAWVALSGELDLVSAPVLKEHLTQFEHDGFSAIMLDLRDLTFIDSQGLHALLRASDRAKMNGHRLILVGASPEARHLFELTKTQFLLDEEEAVSMFGQFTRGKLRGVGQTDVSDVDADV